MAEKKKMSVADILAAARKTDGGQASGSESAEPAEAAAAAPSEAAASDASVEAPPERPAAAKPAASGSGGRMNVADMLAAARAEKAAAAKAEAPKAAPKEKPAPKPAAAKPAAKAPAEKSAAKASPAGPMDTSSILTAARGKTKPGPISKAEAASRGAAPAAKSSPALPPMPAKPDYAKPKAVPPKAVDSGRRTIMLSVVVGSFMSLGFSSLAATMSLWTLGLARFMFPNILREPPSQFTVGFPTDFAPGQVETKFIAQFGVWVVNAEYDGQQQIVALKAVCTHLGCTPNWLEAEQKFKCPCHGSGFYKDGINFEGPAPRPLERYAISIASDGQLLVDKSKTYQEEMGQWEDAASYVNV